MKEEATAHHYKVKGFYTSTQYKNVKELLVTIATVSF